MADHENCVPASIGSGEKALISARIECLCRQMCVLERSHPATTCGISFAGTWFPWEESTTVTGSGVDHRTGDSLSQPVRSVGDAVSCQTAKTLPTTGLGKNPGGVNGCLFIGIATSGTLADGSWRLVKEAYTQADGEYDRVTAHEVRALSASWAYNCQMALPDILSAAFWRSSGIFQNSYLRDMACIADGMSTLGPVVVT